MINEVLEAIKKFVNDEVAQKIYLQKEDTTDLSDKTSFVHPYVEIAYIPHKNFAAYDFEVPYILVSFDEEDDDGEEALMKIRIVFATYGGGFYLDSEGNMTKLPDAKGYKDLLNAIEKTKIALNSRGLIGNKTVARHPYKAGIYDENTWPFFYGYLTFECSGVSDNNVNINNFL